MRILGFLRGWFAITAVAGCALATNTIGCGGGSSSTTNPGPGGDGGDAASSSGSTGEDSGGSSSGGSSTSSSTSSSSGGGADSGADASSSGGADSSADSTTSSSGGSDSGADSSSSSSSGGADAGSDAGSDAGADAAADSAADAPPACSPNGSACSLGGANGLCVGGTCSTCSGPSGPNSACSAAYGDSGTSGYVCVSGSCTPGNCNASADCSGASLGDICTNNVCTGCTTDGQCKADSHYGSATICDVSTHACVSDSCSSVGTTCAANGADICCGTGPNCIPGNCCTNSQCGAGGSTPACNPATNTCAACDAASGTVVVVDPLNGSDATNSTGSGTVGGQTNGICAFKTIGYALAHLGSAATVNVLTTGPVSVASSGERFPINVTAAVTITGSGGTPTINVVTDTEAFNMTASGATLTELVIDGSVTPDGGSLTPSGTHGILVASGATSITNVEVRNFKEAGIRVQGGTANIGPGTNAHNDGIGGAVGLSGLHVTTSGTAVVTGNSNMASIQFSHNGQSGILVDGGGSVTITGSGRTGSVVAAHNSIDGIEIHQSGATPPLNAITGLLAENNVRDGARLYAGSNIIVRSSVLLGNVNGVDIEPTTGGSATANNDVSNIDLGTNTGNSPGLNILQDATTPNNGAGVCLNIATHSQQTLLAEGNTWTDTGNPAANVDCSMSAGGALTEGAIGLSGRGCMGSVDIGGSGLLAGLNANGIQVDHCACGGQAVCQ